MISCSLKRENIYLHIYNIYTQMFTHRQNCLINLNPFYYSVWKSIHFCASKFTLVFKTKRRQVEIRF